MKTKTFLTTTCIFLINAMLLVSQVNLPSEYRVFAPDFLNQGDNRWSKQYHSWQEYAIHRIKRGDYGSPRNKSPWRAYSDRASNLTYSSPSLSTKYSTLDFMERVYIADIKNGFALVFTDEYSTTHEKGINPSAIAKGWIPLENLLLWEKCPQNANLIYQKGLVVGDPSRNADIVQNPPYLMAPSNSGTSNGNARNLDILFIMKTTIVDGKTYFMLSKELSINSRTFEVKGWLSEDYITLWDQRLCIEPTTARPNFEHFRGLGLFPAVYQSINDAKNLYSSGQQGNPFWIYRDFSRERMNSYTMRSPILSRVENDIYRVASIASIDYASSMEKQKAKNAEDIEAWKSLSSNINIIFVIDATSSMKNYYTPVANALNDVMRRDWEGKRLNVGVVLYRNMADGNKEIDVHRISNNINSAINFISSNKDNVISIGKTHYESLFKGLETALDLQKMGYESKHSNFMIVIGDAGNEGNPDIDILARRMAQNRINLLAFQVNHSNSRAYDVFATQLGAVIKKTVQYRNAPDVQYKLKSNRLYMAQRRSTNAPSQVYTGYKFANPGKSENTEVLKNDIISNIKEFNQLVENKLRLLSEVEDTGLEGGSSLVETRLREILSEFGWTPDRIDSYITQLKRRGVTKLIGYSPIKTRGSSYSMFDYVLFYSLDELKIIIQELKKLESNSSLSNRKAYQDAIVAMGQAFLGQMSQDEIMGMNMDELTAQIYGVPIPLSNCGVKIDEIINRNKVSDSKLEDYIRDFNTKRRGLENIANNSYNGKFVSNGITYLWIPLTDMPGYCAD